MSVYDFESFKMELASCVKEYLPEQYKNADIEFQKVNKSGLGEMTGMMVRTEESYVAPCIYIDQAYSDFLKYKLSIGEVAQKLGETLSQALTDQKSIEGSSLLKSITSGNHDWSEYLSSVEIKAVPVTGNEGYLKDTPHIIQGDIAAVCMINLGSNEEGMMSAKVTDTILEGMGVSKEELFEAARENTRRDNPAHMASMDRMMECIMSGEPMFAQGYDILDEINSFHDLSDFEVGMFVISNERQMNGAAAVFFPEIMDALAEKFPDGFHILPSSLHEVLIVPKSVMAPTLDELSEMVKSVNAEQVAPQDKLSDLVHEYDPQAKSLYIAGGEKPSLAMQAQEEVKETKKDKPSGR